MNGFYTFVFEAILMQEPIGASSIDNALANSTL